MNQPITISATILILRACHVYETPHATTIQKRCEQCQNDLMAYLESKVLYRSGMIRIYSFGSSKTVWSISMNLFSRQFLKLIQRWGFPSPPQANRTKFIENQVLCVFPSSSQIKKVRTTKFCLVSHRIYQQRYLCWAPCFCFWFAHSEGALLHLCLWTFQGSS